jgi:CheY-like chemotaxis protein
VHVLLVEDDDDMRAMVGAALEAAGASLTAVDSAAGARRALSEGAFDVLVSDIAMPDEDGYSLIRSMRASGVHLPAIALTAYAWLEDAREAKAAGFHMHLAKPITPAQLIDAVVELVVVRSA